MAHRPKSPTWKTSPITAKRITTNPNLYTGEDRIEELERKVLNDNRLIAMIEEHLSGTGHTTLAAMRAEFDAMRAVLDPQVGGVRVWKKVVVDEKALSSWKATRPKEGT